MKFEQPKYEYPIEGIASSGKPGEPAGIYMLNGAWQVARLDSVILSTPVAPPHPS